MSEGRPSWLGDVDEFAVYKGVFSLAEIVDHYNNGAGKYYASASEAPVVVQAPASDFKLVSYTLPNTTSLGPVNSPLQQTSTNASFTYDGDGRQVKAVVGGVTTYYVGAHYQVDNGVVTKYSSHVCCAAPSRSTLMRAEGCGDVTVLWTMRFLCIRHALGVTYLYRGYLSGKR